MSSVSGWEIPNLAPLDSYLFHLKRKLEKCRLTIPMVSEKAGETKG